MMNSIAPLIVALCVAHSAYGQTATKPRPQARAASSLNASKYDAAPFNIDSTQLSQSYRGHDLFAVIRNFKLPPTKREFEKTEEFDERFSKWRSNPFIGTVTPADLMAIELIPGLSPDSLKVEYDADSEEFQVKVNFENRYFPTGSVRWLESFYRYTSLGSRSATTRMGIKFRVTSHASSSIGIGIPDSIDTIRIKFKSPRNQAMETKAAIRAYAVIKLVEPYIIVEEKAGTASLDNPHEWLTKYFGVAAKLESVLIVNWRSGEILTRVSSPFANCLYNAC